MATNVYQSRRRVYVEPFPGNIKYGFLTNVAAAVGTSCGHTAVPADPPVGLCFGANQPKPGKASKRRVNGTDSTFYDHSRYGALRTDGWSLTLPRRRRGSNGANSRSVYVTIQGVKYAWKMPIHTYTSVGAARGDLGIQDATENDTDLVWGASSPKPDKVSRVVVGADNVDVISTFVDPSRINNLPEGWSAGGNEEVPIGG